MHVVSNKDTIYHKTYWISKNSKDCKKIRFAVRVNLESDITAVCHIFQIKILYQNQF